MLKKLISAAAMLLLVPAAHANVVFEQSPVDRLDGFGSDEGAGQILADDVFLPVLTSITGITWWGNDLFGGLTDDFTVAFYADDGGFPSVTPFFTENFGDVASVDSGLADSFGFPIEEYSATFSAPVVADGIFYVSIYNDFDNLDTWLWAASGPGLFFEQLALGEAFALATGETNLAFRLEGSAVPLPGGLVLMLTALGGAGALRRSRGKPA